MLFSLPRFRGPRQSTQVSKTPEEEVEARKRWRIRPRSRVDVQEARADRDGQGKDGGFGQGLALMFKKRELTVMATEKMAGSVKERVWRVDVCE